MPYKLDGLIDEACQLKCCKLCAHSWLPYEAEYGFCKHQKNAFGPFPKRITELMSCPLWEATTKDQK